MRITALARGETASGGAVKRSERVPTLCARHGLTVDE